MKSFFNIALFFSISLFFSYCSNTTGNKKNSITVAEVKDKAKPASSYQDTLLIHNKAAVFYFPDSFQLKKIQLKVEKSVFESREHESFYQIRNAKNVIKQNTPSVSIRDAKNVRYLKFIKENDTTHIIDLDSKLDPYGLFLFDGNQDPKLVDMMNVDTELWFYFKNSH